MSGFQSPAGADTLIQVTCTAGNLFSYNGYKLGFKNYICKAYPYHTAKKNGARCYNNGVLIDIGYEVQTRWLHVMTVCHDEVTEENYYAKHRFTPANAKFQSGMVSFSFFYCATVVRVSKKSLNLLIANLKRI